MTETEVDPSMLNIVNPATGQEITTIPAASAREVADAAERAQRVFDSGVWSTKPPRDRAAVLLRLADLMERDAEILAQLDCQDAGKPITECRTGDVPGAVESIQWFAEAADKVFRTRRPDQPRLPGDDQPGAGRRGGGDPALELPRWLWPPGR